MGYIVYMNCGFYLDDFVICVCFVFVCYYFDIFFLLLLMIRIKIICLINFYQKNYIGKLFNYVKIDKFYKLMKIDLCVERGVVCGFFYVCGLDGWSFGWIVFVVVMLFSFYFILI